MRTKEFCVQVKTHSAGRTEGRGVSSYQVEDDLHGAETHVHSVHWNFVWPPCFHIPQKMTEAGRKGESVALGEHSSFSTLFTKST